LSSAEPRGRACSQTLRPLRSDPTLSLFHSCWSELAAAAQELAEAVEAAGAARIAFNPLAPAYAAKALARAAEAEALPLAPEAARGLAERAAGDLRAALEALQLAAAGAPAPAPRPRVRAQVAGPRLWPWDGVWGRGARTRGRARGVEARNVLVLRVACE